MRLLDSHQVVGLVVICLASLIVATVCYSDEAAPSPEADAGRLPNVILVGIDALRSDHLGCYGYQRPTSPNIDRIAKEGTLFERCYSTAPWTMPSFMSMFTGLSPAAHRCRDAHAFLDEKIPTLALKFKEKGYYCAAILMNPTMKAKYGLDRGFDKYDNYSVELATSLVKDAMPKACVESVEKLVASHIVTRLAEKEMLLAKEKGKPLFLFAHYFDPHYDFMPPYPQNTQFDPDYKGEITGENVFAYRFKPPTARDVEHWIALYDGEIAYTDIHVGKLIEAADRHFGRENTLAVLVSDHGEAFYEHGGLLHNLSVHREEVQVAMIWRWPGQIPAGRRISQPISTLDIPVTLGEFMRFPRFDIQQGKSLWPAFRGQSPPDDRPILSDKKFEDRRHVAVTQGDLRLHARFVDHYGDETTTFELYDVARDRDEKTNLLDTKAAEAESLKKSLGQLLREAEEIAAYYYKDKAPKRVELTDEERKRLESLGYINSSK